MGPADLLVNPVRPLVNATSHFWVERNPLESVPRIGPRCRNARYRRAGQGFAVLVLIGSFSLAGGKAVKRRIEKAGWSRLGFRKWNRRDHGFRLAGIPDLGAMVANKPSVGDDGGKALTEPRSAVRITPRLATQSITPRSTSISNRETMPTIAGVYEGVSNAGGDRRRPSSTSFLSRFSTNGTSTDGNWTLQYPPGAPMKTIEQIAPIDPQQQADDEALMRHAFDGKPLDPQIAQRAQERRPADHRGNPTRAWPHRRQDIPVPPR